MPDLTDIDVIAPNFKRRMSGVTSTVIRLVPLQARHINIVSSGPKLPPDLPQVPMMQLLQLPKDRPIVWHARRNSEMLPGLILKHVFRKNLKLVFTSAAQRDHSTYTKWLIGQMDHVIATSARAAAYLQVPNTIIHHGIDTQTFHPVADKEALRAQLKLPQNGPVIGCFGRIRPQKGCDIFVNAMIRVLRDMPEAHAVLMGGVGDKFQDFANDLQHDIKIANLSDRFRILPEAPDFQITQYFQALDLYVAPQRWEGFGLTPLEAMSCGLPVIATRVGAFEDIVEDGVTGTLVNTEDPQAIASAALRVLGDADIYMSQSRAARARADALFRLENEAQQILTIYRDLLA